MQPAHSRPRLMSSPILRRGPSRLIGFSLILLGLALASPSRAGMEADVYANDFLNATFADSNAYDSPSNFSALSRLALNASLQKAEKRPEADPLAMQSKTGSTTTTQSGRRFFGDVISFAPRVWITQVNTLESDDFDIGAYFVPMYGASILITPPQFPRFSIVATGFYGEGDADADAAPTMGALFENGDAHVRRIDVELLFRYNIPETQIIIFAGPRYVVFDTEIDFDMANVEELGEIIVAQVGVGGFANLSESARHRFFGNLTLGVAFESFDFKSDEPGFTNEESGDDVTGTVDINVGYEYLVTGWASLNLRYRMFVFFGEDDFGSSDLTTVHGPEIGVALRF